MKFGIINYFNLAVVAIILIPNIIYALRFRGVKNKCMNKFMNTIEQIGRYSSMLLMLLPIGVWEFEFHSQSSSFTYLFGNGILLFSYIFFWMLYFRKQDIFRALALAMIPTAIFILTSLTLDHMLLLASGIVFGIGHIYVTWCNNK